MYFVKSSTTATLQLWPARLVPEPRASIGALERSAHGDRGAHVFFVAWHDNANGYLPVVRGVGGVQRPAAAIEAHFAAHGAPELAVELGGAFEGVDRFSVRTER